MAYPTGSGSERLMRGGINAQSDTETAFKFDGTSPTTGTNSYTVPANHIITVLGIIVCEQGNATETFSLYAGDGSNNIVLVQGQSIGAYQTFVFSDKVVLQGGDSLKINAGNTANLDVWYSYIDQDWT
tara:strand:- start:46 stop:429 length:384 start_codon:yes stop_codon:yes gene_type:complete